MNKIELFQASLGFTTGIGSGEFIIHKCRDSFFNKSTREKVETVALAICTAASMYAELSSTPAVSSVFMGGSLGLNIASVSAAGRCENRFFALMNLATISSVFYHHFVARGSPAPEAIMIATLALGTLFYARHKTADELLVENDELLDENDGLIDENDRLLDEYEELLEENSFLAEEIVEHQEDTEALAREREEVARLRAYTPFIDHHISTGHVSPRQLQEARERFQAINEYQASATPARPRSLSRTRTAKMVANRRITKH